MVGRHLGIEDVSRAKIAQAIEFCIQEMIAAERERIT
jgi:hypothetical protein